MEHNGQTPAKGPVVVTGATGGVGGIAIDMLAGRGYDVVAVTGKAESVDYLKSLGAGKVLLRSEIDYGKRPMESAQCSRGAIDNVGGDTLTWLTRTVDTWGNIASIGMAGSADLHTTVMPFIIRGVNLLGINSAAQLRDTRLVVWNRIATDLKPRHLDQASSRRLFRSPSCRVRSSAYIERQGHGDAPSSRSVTETAHELAAELIAVS